MISVVIPIYNRSKVLMRCLQSFENQPFRPLELILVDNASKDDSYQLCLDFQKKHQSEHFRIKVLQEMKPGACAARNAGMKSASGDYIGFFDSDDEIYPEYFTCLAAAAEGHPKAAVIAMRSHLESQGKKHLHPKRCGVDAARHLVDPLMVTHSFIVRRENALCWNEDLARWQDFDYGFRLLWTLQEEEIVWLNKPLYVVHASDDSISGNNYSKDADELKTAMDAVEAFLLTHDSDNSRLKAALAFKKISLACLLLHEKLLPAEKLFEWKSYAEKARRKAPKKYRLLLALHEAYSKRGGRGFWRIFSLFL